MAVSTLLDPDLISEFRAIANKVVDPNRFCSDPDQDPAFKINLDQDLALDLI